MYVRGRIITNLYTIYRSVMLYSYAEKNDILYLNIIIKTFKR